MSTGRLPQPTRVRYLVVGLATVMAILLYLDRICLSFLDRYIREDLNLSNNQAGWLLGVFFWAYALGQVPAGWLSDRFGVRPMLALYILLWSLFTGFMGLTSGFILLVIFRFSSGLAQAGAYPASAGMISKWIPFSARGLASGIISTGGRTGGFAAQVLTAYLLVAFVPTSVPSLIGERDLRDPALFLRQLQNPGSGLDAVGLLAKRIWPDGNANDHGLAVPTLVEALNRTVQDRRLCDGLNLADLPLPQEAYRLAGIADALLSQAQVARRNRLVLEAAFPDHIRKIYRLGWRPTLWSYGLAGVLVAALFWLMVRNRPAEHPGCNDLERALIEQGRLASSPHGHVDSIPWRLLARSGNLWLSSISQFGTNFGWAFLITWLPRYLGEVHQVPVLERGWLAGLPMLIGMSGMMAGGWLTDRLTRGLGLRWGRGLPMALTRFIAMAAYLACLLVDTPAAATATFCIVAIATDMGTAALWAFNQDVGGKHVGSVLGWGNMWGAAGAACSATALNWLIEGLGWNACFLACALAFLVSGLAALAVDATVPLLGSKS